MTVELVCDELQILCNVRHLTHKELVTCHLM